MKKKRFLAVCATLLVACFIIAACGAAAVNHSAPAPASAPVPPTAAPPAAGGAFGYGGGAFAIERRVEAWGGDVAVDSADVFMEEMEVAAPEFAFQSVQYDMVVGSAARSGPAVQQVAAPRRMIVTTFNISAETMEFDESVDFITSAVNELGGFIEDKFVGGHSIRFDDRVFARSASFTVRVPTGMIHEFVRELGENTNIVSTSENAHDITDSYFDNQARLASLVNQERLLNGLLNSEGAGLEYILQVHRELANVRHEIERLNSAIQRMDQAVSLSTAHIHLQEVMEYRPVEALPTSFAERINQATSNSWNNFVSQTQRSVVNFIWRLPFLIRDLLRLVFWVAVFLIVRKIIRKKKGRSRGESTFEWLNLNRLGKQTPPKTNQVPEQPNNESDGK